MSKERHEQDPDRRVAHLSKPGSPDPDGRQIDGLGGGISSLSKAAVVGKPGEGHSIVQATGEPFPGVEWADDVERAQDEKDGWDVVYRFGQVPVNDTNVDWGSTCGNLVAAVGQVSRLALPHQGHLFGRLFADIFATPSSR